MKYPIQLTLLSSLVHTEETNSNIANLFKEKILVGDTIYEVPALHGNSIRGTFRDLLANHLLETIEIEPRSLSTSIFHTLFSGGSLEKSEGIIDIEKKREIRRLLPMLSIFGSAMGNEMLEGKLKVTSAFPRCKELNTGDQSMYDLLQIVRYTRQDDMKKIVGEKHSQSDGSKQQMFYDIEVLVKGSILDFEIYLDSLDKIEIGALMQVIRLFLEEPFFGGKSSAGHGKVRFEMKGYKKKLADEYIEFLKKNKGEIKNLISQI